MQTEVRNAYKNVVAKLRERVICEVNASKLES
jgi:hypothetical protein